MNIAPINFATPLSDRPQWRFSVYLRAWRGFFRTQLLLGAIALTGCERWTAADRKIETRIHNLERTAGMFLKSEGARPQRLEGAVAFMGKTLQREAARTERDLDYGAGWIRRDFERFDNRLLLYRDEAARRLWGKPEKIEGNAAKLIF